jgi:hypothetical protein
VVADDVLGSVTLSTFIQSSGVQAEPFAALYYEPAGSALDQVPGSGYEVTEVFGELVGPPNDGRNPNLLPLVLNQVRDVYGQADFEGEFRSYFQAFLQDIDPDEAGLQLYFNCSDLVVDTLEQAYWCGPSRTWPQMEYNHAYIEFWHHLDAALAGEIAEVNVDQLANFGPASINDAAWKTLFGLGDSSHNGITATGIPLLGPQGV